MKRKKLFINTAKINSQTLQYYYDRLHELAISVFEWKNLPDTINERYLEEALFSTGKAVFFKDDVLGFLALRCTVSNNFSVYGEPLSRQAYGVNGYHKQLTPDDSVVIYNNYIKKGSVLDIDLFANKLYNIDRTIDININAQKTPVLILCDESEKLTLENIYMQYEGNFPVIKGIKGLNAGNITTLTTGAPYVSDKLYEIKTQYWNEVLTYLGISNINIIKKERLITDEVQRNLGGVVASRYSPLEMRRTACEEINKMFGLDVWCDFRTEVLEETVMLNKVGENIE